MKPKNKIPMKDSKRDAKKFCKPKSDPKTGETAETDSVSHDEVDLNEDVDDAPRTEEVAQATAFLPARRNQLKRSVSAN